MKNRIFAMVLVLALCALPLFSCSGETVTAASLYKGATDALASATGLEAKFNLLATQTYEGETMSMSLDYTFLINGDNMKVSANLGYGEEKVLVTYIFLDGYLYADGMGQKIKGEIDAKDLKTGLEGVGLSGCKPSEAAGQDIPLLTEEALKDVELKTEEDGSYSFFVVLTADDVKNISVLKNASDEIELKDISATFTFSKDKVLTSCEVKFTAIEDEDKVVNFSSKVEYVNLGTAPTVTAPADADQYTEMDLSEMM